MVQQDDVGEAVQVLQAFGEFGEDLDRASNPGSPCGLDGHTLNVCERAMNHANWPIADFHNPTSNLQSLT
jgi:hypothetical protein